jgi:hypothetical protein
MGATPGMGRAQRLIDAQVGSYGRRPGGDHPVCKLLLLALATYLWIRPFVRYGVQGVFCLQTGVVFQPTGNQHQIENMETS